MTLLFSNVSPVTSASPSHNLMVESLPANTFVADGDSVDVAAFFVFHDDGLLQFQVGGTDTLLTIIGGGPFYGVKFGRSCQVRLDVRLTRVGIDKLLVEPVFSCQPFERGSGEQSNGFLACDTTDDPPLVTVDFAQPIALRSYLTASFPEPLNDDAATQHTLRAVAT